MRHLVSLVNIPWNISCTQVGSWLLILILLTLLVVDSPSIILRAIGLDFPLQLAWLRSAIIIIYIIYIYIIVSKIVYILLTKNDFIYMIYKEI